MHLLGVIVTPTEIIIGILHSERLWITHKLLDPTRLMFPRHMLKIIMVLIVHKSMFAFNEEEVSP